MLNRTLWHHSTYSSLCPNVHPVELSADHEDMKCSSVVKCKAIDVSYECCKIEPYSYSLQQQPCLEDRDIANSQ